METKFKLIVRNIFVTGEIFIPEKFNGKTVILSHGFSNDRHQRGQFDDLKKVLLKNNYSVCWFDFPGTGKSSGKFEDTTLSLQKETLNKIINYIYRFKSIDKNNIFLFAMSFSTVSAILLNSKKIKAYIFTGTNANPYKVISDLFLKSHNEKIFKNEFKPNGISIRTNATGKILKLKPKFWKSVKNIKLSQAILKINKPKLFIHGEKDNTAIYKDALEIYKKVNKPKELIVIKNGGHNFDESKAVRSDFLKKTVSWLNRF